MSLFRRSDPGLPYGHVLGFSPSKGFNRQETVSKTSTDNILVNMNSDLLELSWSIDLDKGPELMRQVGQALSQDR